MRILELHCDYVKFKPRDKALKSIGELGEEEKKEKKLENVLVVFSSFEEGDDSEVVKQAAEQVKKNYDQVKAHAILVYPYAHLSSNLAKPAIATKLLEEFYHEAKKFAKEADKAPFGYYKEFELKCKGHPLAELSKTITSAQTVKKLGAKDSEFFPQKSIFADYGKATEKTLAQNSSMEAQRNTAALLLVKAAQGDWLQAKNAVVFSKDSEAYIDFDCRPLTPNDIEKLQEKAKELQHQALAITTKKVSKEHDFITSPPLREAAKEVDGALLFVEVEKHGQDWLPGPFTHKTSDVKAFLITKFGGSYWKNNSKNAKLQRVNVRAFSSEKDLESYVALQKEAEKRDHRTIGKQLELFSFHEEGAGFPFYHPAGATLRNELLNYLREEYQKRDYREIVTPVILNEDLWHKSGHWDHYNENMYFTSIDGVPHAVKPMNCPGSILIYANRPRSYRELPLRLAEFGLDHRHELSGVLSGLFRVRAFTQDDAHLYCTHEQILDEVSKMLEFVDKVYSTFGFTYSIELSTKPENAMGDSKLWEQAEDALKKALKQNKKPFEIHEGDGAFYGPKIDFKIKDALGREWQCGTIQLDFQMPENFDLHYEGSDSKRHRPAMVHRAIYGSLERFMGVVIEHFGGAFPTWLAPTQAIVLPLTDDDSKYAEKVKENLQENGIRVKLDTTTGKIEGRIRDAQVQKIPYMLVVGSKELESKTVSVRKRDGSIKHGVKLDGFTKNLLEEIKERKL